MITLNHQSDMIETVTSIAELSMDEEQIVLDSRQRHEIFET